MASRIESYSKNLATLTYKFPTESKLPSKLRKCSNFEVSSTIFQSLATIFVLYEMFSVITIRIFSSASNFDTFGQITFPVLVKHTKQPYSSAK